VQHFTERKRFLSEAQKESMKIREEAYKRRDAKRRVEEE